MQIRLTVALPPRGGRGAGDARDAAGPHPPRHSAGPPPPTSANVLVTAPAGTVLAAVTGALASSAAAALAAGPAPSTGSTGSPGSPGSSGASGAAGSTASTAATAASPASPPSPAPASGPHEGRGPQSGAGRAPGAAGGEGQQEPVVVYAGTRRLDPHRQIIGEPPLLDGAVISLHAPVTPAALPAHGAAVSAYGSAKARLHVVAGPDAGGIHLLQGGKVLLGRSADADVPLDDPDVSRLHCSVTVTDGGTVTVADIGSTNGTALDGAPVGTQPVLFRPGSTLRIGESAVRLEATGAPAPDAHGAPAVPAPPPLALPTEPDGEGRLRVRRTAQEAARPAGEQGTRGVPPVPPDAAAAPPGHPAQDTGGHAYAPAGPFPGADGTHGAGVAPQAPQAPQAPPPRLPGAPGTDRRRARGLSAWARRFTGARGEEESAAYEQGSAAAPEGPYAAGRAAGGVDGAAHDAAAEHTPGTPQPGPGRPGAVPHPAPYGPGGYGPGGRTARGTGEAAARWPDPAAVLLTALGPGPRLWERDAAHPDALTVRLGSAHRADGHGEPVTVDLRQAGALGLAGPRARLAGLARSVVAQLAALHGPSSLEIVLLAADRSRTPQAHAEEWSWLGWLPHLRPAHGQDCTLLTAHDRDQAAARTAELLRRLEARETAPNPAAAEPDHHVLVVVDGDPGSAGLRENVTRLAREGAAAGVHVLCLAETPAASPASPVAATVEAANATCPAFAECGALALLSGDVATAVRVLYRAPHTPHGPASAAPPQVPAPGAESGTAGWNAAEERTVFGSGTADFTAPTGPVAAVDAVSAAWAERFARSLAPLREPEEEGTRAGTRPAVTLPRGCRLLDELGLARATPAALLARWSERNGPAGRVPLVLGAGPHGPLEADLADVSGGTGGTGGAGGAGVPPVTDSGADAGPGAGASSGTPGHALVSGGPGTGKTELLRALTASLAAGERPDRLALVLVDGGGPEAGDGLRACTELPHVTGHLTAGDPVRMREFAQALSAELKRRAELIGDQSDYEEYMDLAARPGGRVVAQRRPAERPAHAVVAAEAAQERAEARVQERADGGGQARQGAAHAEERGGLDTLPPQAPREPADGPARVPGTGQEPTAAVPASAPDPAPGQGADSGSGSGAGSGDASGSGSVRGTGSGSAPGREPAQGSVPGSTTGRETARGPAGGPGRESTQGSAPGSGSGHGSGRGSGSRRDSTPGSVPGSGAEEWRGPGVQGQRGSGAEGARVPAGREQGGSGAPEARPAGAPEQRVGSHGAAPGGRGVPGAEGAAGRAPEQPGAGAGRGEGAAGGQAGPREWGEQAEPDVTRRTLRLRRRDGEERGGTDGRALSAFALPGGDEDALPRLAVVVDDFDTLVAPALGNPGRPAAGSVVRALESVARSGARLGVHLIAATGRAERTEATAVAQGAALHARLTGTTDDGQEQVPGRGALTVAGSAVPPVPFQAGRVTGRIPRTATLRPTVVPLDWSRAGDPPARRPVRELGNGPTDLALLASAVARAAQQVSRSS
ncbi:FHA domain-containing protein [Streptomyces cacaoi]|uniref:FHA domain-containing protein n=1 Tax=Streptomyces cacaoi TaxID=1898 RepID=UPI0033329852